MPKILDLLSAAGVDPGTARRTVINWPNQIVTIVDGYRSFRGVPHGVQKDAIQNMWDARKDKKKGRGWSARFEVLAPTGGHTFLCMTDAGTTGLTGRILQPAEIAADLPAEERWGRFENVAFTKDPSEEALGARGRGKFIFVGASKASTIIYDTLRDDGVYRVGIRTLELTDSPIWAYEGSEARRKLDLLTESACTPLAHVGTRVIIVDPIDDLLADISSGRFARFIGETWWEIIRKFGVDIKVIVEGRVERAKIPEDSALPESDSKDYKVWIREGDIVKVGREDYRLKKLHIVHSMRGPVPEDLRGVSVQRGGMKVCSIPMRYVPAEVAESVYGYATLDRELEHAILPHENPEHYNFDWSKPVPKELRNYIQRQLERFGREKLGLGVDPGKVRSERQRNAELRALYSVNRIAKKMGLVGTGGGGSEDGESKSKPKKDLRVEIPPLVFPREIRRVNYGESVRNIRLIAHNKGRSSVKVQVQLSLEYEGQEVKKFIKKDITMSARRSRSYGPFKHRFKKGNPKGEYRIHAVMISLRQGDKGTVLDKASAHLWVEQDPPERGIFKRVERLEYRPPKDALMGDNYQEGKSYVFTYNVVHPAHEREAELDGEDRLSDYLVRLMAYEVARIDMASDDPKLFEEEDLETPQLAVQKASDVVGQILREYHSS